MTISIIIAVKHLNENLKECLRHCLNLDYPDYEIIVFPDEAFIFDNPKVKVIATGNISPPRKRDLALKEAKGEVLAFIDDDAYPERSWLGNAAKNFSDPEVAAVGGPAITPESDSLLQKAGGEVYRSFLVSGWQSYRYWPGLRKEVDDYPSCNFMVRSEIFSRLGGFNTNYWPGEDTALCLEITRRLKKKIIYDPTVLVYHHRRQLFIPHLKQIANYALHRGYFVRKFPQTSLRFSYFVPSLFLVFILGGFFLPPDFGWLRSMHILGLGIYALLVSIFSLSRDMRLMYFKQLGIILTHFTYGLFFLKGLFSLRLKEDILK